MFLRQLRQASVRVQPAGSRSGCGGLLALPAQAKTILVTGAGSGLGRGICEHFGRKGLTVIATDLGAAAARETADIVQRNGGTAASYALDVSDQKAVQALVAGLPEGRVDILVNNAGLQHVSPLADFPPEKWGLLIDVMLKGVAWMTRAVLPGMRQRNYGRVVNIGSVHCLVASPCKTAYVSAKHGLVGFTKGMALETGDVDVTINTICPAYIRTPLVEGQIAAQAKVHGIPEEEVINKIMLTPMPKKAFIGFDEISGTIQFLSSNAAKNINGQNIAIDGGWTCH